jgi:Bacterial regulatory proteins, lacI family
MSEGEEELNVGAVRLEEVASAANVSLSTASKALRGKPHVSEKTRIRVIDAAQRLGYSAAEAMASMARLSVRDSHGVQDFRVGIIGVDMKGVFSPTILIGAENAFQARSAAALLFNASGNEALFHSGIERMLVQGVSGLLIISRRTDPVPYYVDSPVPVVYAYGPSRDPDDCSVAQDNVESGCLAVRHLLSCGRTRIAIIAGDSECSVAHERMRGALKALHDAGLQLVGEARFGSWEAEWGAPLPVCCSMTVLHSTQ